MTIILNFFLHRLGAKFLTIFLLLFSIMLFVFAISGCSTRQQLIPAGQAWDEARVIEGLKEHPNPRMRLKLIQSKIQDKRAIWKKVEDDLEGFTELDYRMLKPFIYEQDILTIQNHVNKKQLSYEQLVKWYLYRIIKFESDPSTTLHTIMALNPHAVEEARRLDANKSSNDHPIFGMPILLKDNINTAGMITTAGAIALQNNEVADAHIVKQLKANGAIILGKVNLSEWAYFFCAGCPVGYSAIGGQTLNPYGRAIFETGGSSSGSGTSVAANYAVAAVGTETSGSILSPSSKNALVGLKPTVGLLSRSGIVPISSTLDTPGPMTKSVSDNLILLSALNGEDSEDNATQRISHRHEYTSISGVDISAKRMGVIKAFLADSIYSLTIGRLRKAGAVLVEFDPPKVNFDGFSILLEADMQRDLPQYLRQSGSNNIQVKSVAEVIAFNNEHLDIRAPYGQARLEGSANDTTSDEELAALSERLELAGREYFAMDEQKIDIVLSMNNMSAGYAAAAKYPCLTLPMGFSTEGESTNITLIARNEQEAKLYEIGLFVEKLLAARKPPVMYAD